MEFFNPVRIIAGKDAIKGLGKAIEDSDIQGEKVLLVTRGGDFLHAEEHRVLRQALNGYDIQALSFEKGNPDIVDLFSILQQLRLVQIDLVVAVGGGSVLDVAKCVATLHTADFSDVTSLRHCIAEGVYPMRTLPWIGIPTTSGTGSEVTPWATIWDKETGGKLSLNNPQNFARLAVVDPTLTKSLPLGLTVASALDAVCHAVESYWARQTNEVSRAFALLAIRRIADNLATLVRQPEDERLREEIGKGSLYAGLAFSNTKTTICHSVSYPLTSMFGIPHGIAAALTLAEFMRFNAASTEGMDELFAAFGCRNAEEVGNWIADMMQLGGCKTRLSNYGVKRADFSQILQHAFTKGRADNNPVAVTEKDVQAVLEKIY